MRAWQKSRGLRQTSWIDVSLYAEIATMPDALTRYVITAEDEALVTGPLPATWAERARMKLLGYETLGACIAERFHTSERTLRRLNPAIINWPEDLHAGTILTVPNVTAAALEKPSRLVVALDECVLAGYNAEGTMLLRFPCSIARNRAHLPDIGTLKIKNMAPAPNYTYDPANYGQDPSVGKMVVPAGPRNPVGSRWIGLSLSGYGIHGTPRPNSVGRPESRGCFRLTNWNAEKLFELVTTGTPVEVVQSLSSVTPPAKSATAEDATAE
jgi:lipoprotein-anchoring transpeptidase ErfK/SrfK